MQYISILSTVVAFAFTISVFQRYRRRGGTHLLLWGIGLFFFGLGTLTEVILLFTYSDLVLKVWYLCGAMLTAAWLGQGTVHLLVRRPGIAITLTVILTIVSIVAAILIFTTPVNASAAAVYNLNQPASAQYQDILVRSGIIVFLTIILNIYGTVTLVGGAIYSAFIFWRKRVMKDRMIGNILIAAGALLPALGGTFIRIGLADWLYLSEFIGIILMYSGFIKATAGQPADDAQISTPISST